jgi:hypothetical protein
MIIPRQDFRAAYERIKDSAADVKNGCSVILFVAADVDAICASRILVVRSAAVGARLARVPVRLHPPKFSRPAPSRACSSC